MGAMLSTTSLTVDDPSLYQILGLILGRGGASGVSLNDNDAKHVHTVYVYILTEVNTIIYIEDILYCSKQ